MKKILTFFIIFTLTSISVSNIIGCGKQPNVKEKLPEKEFTTLINNFLDKIKYDFSSKWFVFKEGYEAVKSQYDILNSFFKSDNSDLVMSWKDDLFLGLLPLPVISNLKVDINNQAIFSQQMKMILWQLMILKIK